MKKKLRSVGKLMTFRQRTTFATMKITGLLMFFGVFAAFADNSFSQVGQVTIKMEDATISSIFDEIETQTNYSLFYKKDVLNDQKVVSISVDNEDVANVLSELLEQENVSYEVVDKNIVIVPRSVERLNNQPTQGSVTGRVVDQDGEPIPGVSIVVSGTFNGTVSDLNGDYKITGVSSQSVLIFSFIGMDSKEELIGSRSTINVRLSSEMFGLDEVVVVGYGTQRKLNLTGAVAHITSKDFEDRPASSLSQLLQGTVPNLNVSFSSGRPGESGSFNIRGVNSISGNASPLVLIDGIEGDMDRLNPNDVESVTVLKDASAAAVYGARASYGVILITTKKGSSDKTTVRYSSKFGVSSLTTSTDYETRGYYSASINDMFFRSYSGQNYTKYTEADYAEMWDRRNDKTEHPDRPWVVTDQRDGRDTYVYYGNTDWYNLLFDNRRPTWEHNVAINGGSENVKYYLSGNMFEEKGVFKTSPDIYKKHNFRSRITADIRPWLEVSNNTNYFQSTYSYPGQGGVNSTFNAMNVHGLASFVPVNPDGTTTYLTSLMDFQVMDGLSAMLINDLHNNADTRYEFSTTFEALFKLHKNLQVTTNYSYVHYNYQTLNRSTNIPYSQYPGEVALLTSGRGLDQLNERQTNHWHKTFNLFGNYSKTFGEHHNFKMMAGTNYETKYLKDLRMSRQDLLTTELNDFNLAVGDVMNLSGGQNEYAILGFFYRGNYDYKNRYLLETSGRYDGTSRFRRGHRFGFFPSLSLGWRISEEGMFDNLKNSISNLMLRASYGSLGNQQVGYYSYMQTINTSGRLNYSFGDGQLASYSSVSSPNASDLTWETVVTRNLGVDIGFLRQRLNFSGDAYVRETSDMLMLGKSLPSVYGAPEPRENAADLQTTGWEVSLLWRDKFNFLNSPLNYSVNVGLSDNTTKITKFDNPSKILNDYYVGQRLGDIWGFVVDGFFLSDQEASNYQVDQTAVNTIINSSAIDPGVRAGDMKFVDLDGDNIISYGANTADNPGDRKIIGNALPRYTLGTTLSANWRGIDISTFFQGVGQQHWYPDRNAMAFWGPYSRPYASFIPKDFMNNVWSEDNPNAFFPRPRGYIALNNENRSLGVVNDKYLQNLAYLRLKNFTLGYSLPSTWLRQIGFERVRVYFSGENLLTFTNLESDFIDPEQAAASISLTTGRSDARVYPWAKTYSFGIDVTF